MLLRGAAVLLVAGAATGCSSQVTRFNSVDDVFTASTDNQRQIINGEGRNQPYPGDVAAAPVQPVTTGSINRGSLPPPSSAPQQMASAAPAPVQAQPVQRPFANASDDLPGAAAQPRTEHAPRVVSETPTAAAPAATPVKRREPAGWSSVGGTEITARQGETVYNLSRRYGVPAEVIAGVNGLPDGAGLKAGQKIVIPTYSQARKVPTAAEGTARTAQLPTDNVPFPTRSPETTAAVLPKPAKVKEEASASAEPAKKPESKSVKVVEAAPSRGGSYTVQSGDTLTAIARKTGVKVADLKAANGITDGGLKIGQSLKVPQGGSIVVAAAPKAEKPKLDKTTTASTGAEQAQPAAYTPPKAEKVIQQAEASAESAPNATGIERMRWPVRGRVITGYGKGGGKANDGIDIAVPEGTAVKAAENGVVIYAGDGLKEFGNTVLVRHENGLVTVYGHASELKVQRGQKVKRGQDIALSGMSGNANAPKLHFEVRKNSAPVDPSTYLE